MPTYEEARRAREEQMQEGNEKHKNHDIMDFWLGQGA